MDQRVTILTYHKSADPANPEILDGRVRNITLPRALQNDGSRIIHHYTYAFNSGDTRPNLYAEHTDVTADDSEPLGGANLGATPARTRTVFMNLLGQMVTDRDPGGNSTTFMWWPDDRIRWTTDPTGRRTGTAYDPQKRVVHVYGPAQDSCFTNEFPTLPKPSGCDVPDKMTAYDGAGKFLTYDGGGNPILPPQGPVTGSPTNPDGSSLMRGLHAAYWTYPAQTGAPTVNAFLGEPHSEELVAPASGVFDKTWAAAPPGIAANQYWLARLTGEVVVPNGQSIGLQVVSDDGVRVYLDDRVVFDYWGCPPPGASGGCPTTATPGNGFTVPAGAHRLRIDYYQETGSASLKLVCFSGCSGTLALSYLNPRYGLVTATRDADGKLETTQYGDHINDQANYARDVARGLPRVETVDPLGLDLQTRMDYESPGDERRARLKTKQLPKGTSTQTTYRYYGGSQPGATQDGRVNPCLPGSTLVIPQGLRLWRAEGPDPDGPDQHRVEEVVYDRMGRVTATRAARADDIGTEAWRCTLYDDRRRVKESIDRLGKTTTYAYQGLTTTVASPDSSGTPSAIVEEVDLLGRVVRYTDEHGTTTRRTYDYLGRLAATWRTFPGGAEAKLTEWSYDPAGRIATLTEYASGVGRATSFSYDAAGRLLDTGRPNEVVTTSTYDQQGNLGVLTHQRNTTTLRSFGYGRSPAGRVTQEAESVTGRTLQFANYDGAGRLTHTIEGSTTRRYAFDANSNRCSTATGCDLTYRYDEADRVTQSPFASSYEYDTYGNLVATVGTPGHPSMTYEYDGNDHATTVNDGTATVTETLSPSGRVLRRVVTANAGGDPTEDTIYGYDGPGDSPAYQKANGTGATPPEVLLSDDFTGSNGSVWNATKWVTTANDSTKTADFQSNEGRLHMNGATVRATAQMVPVMESEMTFTYRFSDRNAGSQFRVFLRASGMSGAEVVREGYRLEVISGNSTVNLHRIDNWAPSSNPLASFSYPPDPARHHLRLQVTGQGPTTIRAKIWAGGATEPSGWQIDYTDTSPVPDPGAAQLVHSGTSGTRSVYVDDLAITNPTAPGGQSAITTYIPGTPGLVVIDTNGVATYPIANGHGDIVATTDSAGTLTPNPPVDEYGVGGTNEHRLGWLGDHQRHTTHTATGIMRMGVRLYDPNLGRFLSVDPIEGGSANDYDYANCDPVNNYDFDGTICQTRTAGTAISVLSWGAYTRALVFGLNKQPRKALGALGFTFGQFTLRRGVGVISKTAGRILAKGLIGAAIPATILDGGRDPRTAPVDQDVLRHHDRGPAPSSRLRHAPDVRGSALRPAPRCHPSRGRYPVVDVRACGAEPVPAEEEVIDGEAAERAGRHPL